MTTTKATAGFRPVGGPTRPGKPPSPEAPPQPGSTDPRRRLGAHAHHLAGRLLRSSFTQLRLRSLRCSAPTHDLAHLDTNSLAANRWIRAQGEGDLYLSRSLSPGPFFPTARTLPACCHRRAGTDRPGSVWESAWWSSPMPASVWSWVMSSGWYTLRKGSGRWSTRLDPLVGRWSRYRWKSRWRRSRSPGRSRGSWSRTPRAS